MIVARYSFSSCHWVVDCFENSGYKLWSEPFRYFQLSTIVGTKLLMHRSMVWIFGENKVAGIDPFLCRAGSNILKKLKRQITQRFYVRKSLGREKPMVRKRGIFLLTEVKIIMLDLLMLMVFSLYSPYTWVSNWLFLGFVTHWVYIGIKYMAVDKEFESAKCSPSFF